MRRILFALFFVLCCALSASGQEARLTGLITDPSSAVIPQASISLRNQDTGVKYQTESNGSGIYTFAFVKPGPYDVIVEKSGFKTVNRSNIKLDVSQYARIDFTLDIGATTQTVEVTAGVPLIDTSDATVSDVITGKQVLDLNLNGRDLLSLTTLVPGAAQNNSFTPQYLGFGAGSQLLVSFNGGRVNDSNMEVDGSNNEDTTGGGRNVVTFPNIDSIAEFRISTSNYGADVGKRPGADIEVVTKSGTKDFHGTAFEFVRNDALDANDFFLNQTIHPANAPANYNAFKQPLKWNLFGYNLGGPVTVPGHHSHINSRTFFFWSENWARYRVGSVLSAGVPTQRMRVGDFSECDSTSANYNAVVASGCKVPKNPATGLPMDTFASAGYSINPNALAILNGLVPLANNGPDGYVSALDIPQNYRQENVRVDQNLGDKTTAFLRFTQEKHLGFKQFGSYDTALNERPLTTKNASFNFVHNLKPNMVNEFIFGWENDWQHYLEVSEPSSPDGSDVKPSTWTAQPIFPANATNKSGILLPVTTVSGGLPFSFTASTRYTGIDTYHPSGTFKDDVTYTVAKHTLKWGVFLLDFHTTDYTGSQSAPQGTFKFNATGPGTTGNGLADMYLGWIASYAEGSPNGGGAFLGGYGLVRTRMKDFEPYFQDDWKVTHRLTLNLGIRWQYRTDYHEVSNPTQSSDFIPSVYSLAAATQLNAKGQIVPGTGYNFTTYGNGLLACGTGGLPDGCVYPNYGAWGPRFGFAYDPTGGGKTAIRGGYGIFYDIGFSNSPNVTANEGAPPTTLSPTATNISGYQNIVPGLLGPPSISNFAIYDAHPMVQQFNLTLEHQFPANNFLSVAYVGSLGRHLDRGSSINQVPLNSTSMNVPELAGTAGCDSSGNCNVQSILINAQHSNIFFVPDRGFSLITSYSDTAISNYNSLQVNYRHPVGHGLTLQAAYTWERALDDSTAGGELFNVDDFNNLSRWYAPSDNNRNQVFQLNYVYALPFFRDATHHFLRNGLGGWQLSGITSFFTGVPTEFNCTPNGYATGIGTAAMCNSAGTFGISKGVTDDPRYGPIATWFNPNTIAMANLSQYSANGEPGMFGYLGRNALNGPGRNDWDMALLKNFSTPWFKGENANLQFRWETYNTFNHVQWQGISAGCGGATPFGQPCSGNSTNLGNGEVTSDWAPRQMQLGLKFTF